MEKYSIEDMRELNKISSWQQGSFVDHWRYQTWSQRDKEIADHKEKYLVRPAPEENAVCQCPSHAEANWIASRLNTAAKLEELVDGFIKGTVLDREGFRKLKDYLSEKRKIEGK